MPWEVIKELESDNSRLFKESVVKRESDAANTVFFLGAKAALDAMVTFGVKKIETKIGDGKGISEDAFWKTANGLAARQITGNAAQTAINFLRMNATEDQWNYWYRRILIKDLRCGVSETTINKMVPAEYQIPVFTCQLAHDGAHHDDKMTGEKIIEIKLDGVRVISIVYPNGQVDQYSRNGKELINFPHIRGQLSRHAVFFTEPMVLDGEVMSSSFQDLMKQVHRKNDVESSDAILNLFDIISLREFQLGVGVHTQTERSNALRAWHSHVADHMPHVAVLGQELVNLSSAEGVARFSEINAQAIAGGYEGIMVKDPLAVYECKRSIAWLKQKPYIEVSLAILDLEEGTGKHLGRLGALVCGGVDDGKDIRVNVGSGFSDKIREDFWSDRKNVIGNIVEVRADAVTQNQDGSYSLRFPRFKGFRGFVPGEKL